MTTESMSEGTESPHGTAAQETLGSRVRWLAWVAGALLGLGGLATTIRDGQHHHLDVGPYLLAAGLLLFFLAALDMRRAERTRARRATRLVRRLTARVGRLERNRHLLEHDRDQWRRMQAEEAVISRRLAEDLRRVQRPHVSGGSAGVASTNAPLPVLGPRSGSSAPPSPSRVRRPRPRHQARRPAPNQPRLFDQDEGG
jgi:hypothetical protein